jgi:glycosyltransferase involved in cell wall biosynthesis
MAPLSYTFVNAVVEPWQSPWLAHQPLMSTMLPDHRVLYVLKEDTFDAVWDRWRAGHPMDEGMERLGQNLIQLRTNKFFPKIYRSRTLDRLSTHLRAWEIRRALDRLDWRNRVLYVWNPHFINLAGKLGEDLCVFHCHDYYPAFHRPGTTGWSAALADWRRMLQAADVVFASSEAILREIAPIRTQDVYLVENGVPYDRFQQALSQALPPDIARIPEPRVGYIGRINRKVDLAVLGAIAKARPDWSVVLMGPLTGWSQAHQAAFDEFRRLPNAYYLPGRDPAQVPVYMKALDVGLMTYVLEDTWTPYGFPLKMFEYFSLGKPVVSADLPSIRKYAPLVKIVNEPHAWVPAIEQALQDRDPAAARQRQDLARQNDWMARRDLVLRVIGESGKPVLAGPALETAAHA